MSLFSRKKTPPSPPPPSPPVSPEPARPAAPAPSSPLPPSKTETVLKLELPDVFAYQNDATRSSLAAVSPQNLPILSQRSRGTIVLVESNDEVRRLLSRLLQQEGYVLHTVTCLAEAREFLREQPADFVLARRACVPLNLETDIALRDVRQKAHTRIVDDFGEMILGQVVDYESMSQCLLALSGLLVSLLEGAHTGVRGHAQTVAKYCRMVGQRLGMTRRELDALTLAACLHDAGTLETAHKISEPTLQENQPPISPSLQSSLDLFANMPFAYAINDLLSSVSEAGAVEGDLLPPPPLGARILRVVDTYDTLRRTRPEQFSDENSLFEWMRRQPIGTFDSDALETLIYIRKSERAINDMDIFRETVLLVDPHPDELHFLGLRLKNDDYHILFARSVTEAVECLKAHPVTLVLTEHRLQGEGTGFDLLRTIKSDPVRRDIPVVFHATGDTTLIKQALELGAEDWYSKPQNTEIVALKIGRILSRVRARPGAAEGVQGSLREMGLIEMVQILCAGNRSVHIQLERENEKGELVIHNGQIINAHYRDLEGEPAVLLLLRWREGNFLIRPLRQAPPAKITASTDALVLQSCVAEDQRKAATTTEPKKNTP